MVLCRAEKQVNGLQNNVDTETDRTQSDNDDDNSDAGKPLVQSVKPFTGRRGKPSTADGNAGKAPVPRGKPSSTADVESTLISDNSADTDEDITVPRPAKVIAGEVIKQWQTKTRSRGCRYDLHCSVHETLQ